MKCEKGMYSFNIFNRSGYRRTDVWASLERNWSNFFWLTGETPGSLQVIVNRLTAIYLPQVARGRAENIDFCNQVYNFIIIFRIFNQYH